MPCPVCNRTIASGDFCDDLQCPNPTRDAAEGAGEANVREAWTAFQMVRETIETLGPVGALPAGEHLAGPTFTHEAEALVTGIRRMTAPPGPAPDAMQKLADKIRYLHNRGLLGYNGEYSVTDADYEQLISALLSALAPPADGATTDALYALELAHSLLPNGFDRDKIWLASIRLKRTIPPGTGAAEPVAWRWRYKDSKGEWEYSAAYPKFASFNLDSMDCEPLYATPPVRGERETIEAVADAIDAARYQHPEHPRARPRPFAEADRSDREYATRLAKAAILSLPVQPGAGEREANSVMIKCAEIADRYSYAASQAILRQVSRQAPPSSSGK